MVWGIDIFGSSRNDKYSKPLPPDTIDKCLRAINEYNARKNEYTNVPPPTAPTYTPNNLPNYSNEPPPPYRSRSTSRS
uniref:Uncharacterized protein n=1 Tax=Parastrongyloides trichosuri TaxID=131310 RepID=A0A0N4ZP27_PARTI